MLFSPDTENRIFQLYKSLYPRAVRLDNLDALVSSRISTEDAVNGFNALLTALANIGGSIERQQTVFFNTPGAFQFVVPSRVKIIWATILGSGGGGGATSYSAAGGGGGAAVYDLLIPVSGGQVLNGNIGAGGVATYQNTTGSPGVGGAGAITIFADISVAGGYGGSAAASGGSGNGGQPGIAPTGVPPLCAAQGVMGGYRVGSQLTDGGLGALSLLFGGAGKGGQAQRSSPGNTLAGRDGAVFLRWMEATA